MTTHQAPAATATGREWTGLAVLLLPLLLVSMDVSVLYFAVPFIGRDLAPSSAQQLWIFDVYGFVLAGLIEARGQGLLRESPIGLARIGLAAHCVSAGEAIERMPEPCAETLAGIALPCFRIDPFEASAPAKLRRALQHLGHGAQQAYQAPSSGGGDRLGTGDTH